MPSLPSGCASAGWEVLYEPEAGVVHRRRVTPERRRELPAQVNYHSLKNRYLIRAYHQGAGLFWRHFVHCTARDLGALVWVLLFERSSLPAYFWLWRRRREILERRRLLQRRRTVPAAEIEQWFRHSSLPL